MNNVTGHTDYWEIGDLDGYYFEDSYIERIVWTENNLTFTLLVVLRESHERYTEPPADEQHCYHKATLEFRDVSRCEWQSLNIVPVIDPDGSMDFGNLDSFVCTKGRYQLSGEWGQVEVESAVPVVRLLD